MIIHEGEKNAKSSMNNRRVHLLLPTFVPSEDKVLTRLTQCSSPSQHTLPRLTAQVMHHSINNEESLLSSL